MELPWQKLTPAEKKAYYISFGEWGPTPLYLPGERSQVFWITTGCIVLVYSLVYTIC